MAEPMQTRETKPQNVLDEAHAEAPQPRPQEPEARRTSRAQQNPSPTLGQQIRAHTNRPHKGDVGRPGTNEEVFQGSKMKELK